MWKHMNRARITIAVTSLLYLIALFALINPINNAFDIYAQIMYFYISLVHPAVLFAFGFHIVRAAMKTNAVPNLLFVIVLLLPLLPTAYIVVPIMFNFTNLSTGAIDIVFFIFEATALMFGLLFFVVYFRKKQKNLIEQRDLSALLHYLVGAMVYFYFIRLTLISAILITNINI